MNITVINGTEKHGVTYRLKEMFLEEFKDRVEYYGILSAQRLSELLCRLLKLHIKGRKHLQGRRIYWEN